MAAEALLREGKLVDALTELQQDIRRAPADAKKRIFLFQLLSVLGQWDRALNQLNVVADLDAETLPMAHTYRELIRCETFRSEVFSGDRAPLIFGKPEQWIALMLEALKLSAQGEYEKAQQLREQAFEWAPATRGEVNGQAFEWIADADSALGPVFEAVIEGRYYWVPFDHVAVIETEAPEDLRDLVWLPAHFQWVNGGESVGFIPSRYPGSEHSDDDSIKLARRTDWADLGNGLYQGLGQRVWVTDVDDYALLTVRSVKLEVKQDGDE